VRQSGAQSWSLTPSISSQSEDERTGSQWFAAPLETARACVRVRECARRARASAKRRRYVEGTQRGTWDPISSPRQPSWSRPSWQNARYEGSARRSDEDSLRHFHHLRVRGPMRPTGADTVVRITADAYGRAFGFHKHQHANLEGTR